jgi:hypothetical protein
MKHRIGISAIAGMTALAGIGCGRKEAAPAPDPGKAPASATSASPSASASSVVAVASSVAPRASSAPRPAGCALLDDDGLAIAGESWGPLRGFSAAVGKDGGSFATVIGRWAYVYDATKVSLDDAKARSLDGVEAVAVVIPRGDRVSTVGRFGSGGPFGLRESGDPPVPTWPDDGTRRVIRAAAGARGTSWIAAGVAWRLACETDDDKCTTTIIGGGRGGGELVPTVERKWDARTGAQLALFYDDGHGVVADPIASLTCDGVDCEGSRGRWDALSIARNETHAMLAYRDQMQIDVLPKTLAANLPAHSSEPLLVAGGGDLSRPSVIAVGDGFQVLFSMRPKAGAPHAIYAATWKPGDTKPPRAKLVYTAKQGGALGASATVRPDGKIAIVWAEGDAGSAQLRVGLGATIEEALAAPQTLSDKRRPVRDTIVAMGPAFGLVAWSAPVDVKGAKPSDVRVRGARFECP